MRRCPKCNRSFDESQSFCLEDGTPLMPESESNSTVETGVSARKRSKLPLALVGLLLLIGAVTAIGLLVYLNRGDANQNNRQKVVDVPPPAPLATPSPTPTPEPTPSPTPAPTVSPEANTNVSGNAETVSNVKPSGNSNSAKQSSSGLKAEDHFISFELQQCRKSGTSITCSFVLINKGQDREFQLVAYRSNLYDELGNGYNGRAGQIANQTGSSPQINFVSGVTTKGQITFEGIDPNAAKITLLRLQYDVGNENGLGMEFRNVPLLGAK